MIEEKIKIGKSPYNLYIGKNMIENLHLLLADHMNRKQVFILTDCNVFHYYGKDILDALKNNASNLIYHVVPAGEGSKSFRIYEEVIGKLVENNYRRDSILLALGGGVVGDLGGFIASTYMRGIEIIHIPTTLLAQVDSSIGGKTGINHGGFKNLLGTFYHPKAVVIDSNTLNTLPNREYLAAFGEIIKYGMLADYDLLTDLEKNYVDYLNKSKDLTSIILKCIKIKEKIVIEDEEDFGLRHILNLGHTFAHGIESSTEFNQFLHGEAVALGLLLAANLAYDLSLIQEPYHFLIKGLIFKYFSSVLKMGFNGKKVLESMIMDKKAKDHGLTFILPIDQGKAKAFKDIPMEAVEKVIQEAEYGLSC